MGADEQQSVIRTWNREIAFDSKPIGSVSTETISHFGHTHESMRVAVKKSLSLAMSRNITADAAVDDLLDILGNHGYVLIHEDDV